MRLPSHLLRPSNQNARRLAQAPGEAAEDLERVVASRPLDGGRVRPAGGAVLRELLLAQTGFEARDAHGLAECGVGVSAYRTGARASSGRGMSLLAATDRTTPHGFVDVLPVRVRVSGYPGESWLNSPPCCSNETRLTRDRTTDSSGGAEPESPPRP